jgi:hypothetical protein
MSLIDSLMNDLGFANFARLIHFSGLSTRMFLANLRTIENWHLKNVVCVAIFRVAPKKHGHCCGTGGWGGCRMYHGMVPITSRIHHL